MKKISEYFSLGAITLGSLYFGYMGQPVEMGLSIVAGGISYALLNLDRFSKIKGAGFEAHLREQISAVIEKETEPYVSGEKGTSVPDVSRVDDNTRLVILALQHQEYTWRYIGGLKKDSELSIEELRKSLEWLIFNGYAKQTLGKHGTVWNLTEEGRYLSAVIDFEDV